MSDNSDSDSDEEGFSLFGMKGPIVMTEEGEEVQAPLESAADLSLSLLQALELAVLRKDERAVRGLLVHVQHQAKEEEQQQGAELRSLQEQTIALALSLLESRFVDIITTSPADSTYSGNDDTSRSHSCESEDQQQPPLLSFGSLYQLCHSYDDASSSPASSSSSVAASASASAVPGSIRRRALQFILGADADKHATGMSGSAEAAEQRTWRAFQVLLMGYAHFELFCQVNYTGPELDRGDVQRLSVAVTTSTNTATATATTSTGKDERAVRGLLVHVQHQAKEEEQQQGAELRSLQEQTIALALSLLESRFVDIITTSPADSTYSGNDDTSRSHSCESEDQQQPPLLSFGSLYQLCHSYDDASSSPASSSSSVAASASASAVPGSIRRRALQFILGADADKHATGMSGSAEAAEQRTWRAFQVLLMGYAHFELFCQVNYTGPELDRGDVQRLSVAVTTSTNTATATATTSTDTTTADTTSIAAAACSRVGGQAVPQYTASTSTVSSASSCAAGVLLSEPQLARKVLRVLECDGNYAFPICELPALLVIARSLLLAVACPLRASWQAGACLSFCLAVCLAVWLPGWLADLCLVTTYLPIFSTIIHCVYYFTLCQLLSLFSIP